MTGYFFLFKFEERLITKKTLPKSFKRTSVWSRCCFATWCMMSTMRRWRMQRLLRKLPFLGLPSRKRRTRKSSPSIQSGYRLPQQPFIWGSGWSRLSNVGLQVQDQWARGDRQRERWGRDQQMEPPEVQRGRLGRAVDCFWGRVAPHSHPHRPGAATGTISSSLSNSGW